MAAKDYIIVSGWRNCYLARNKKPSKRGPETMSEDRRPITDSEMIGLFEFYLRRYCRDNNTDEVVITTRGKKIFKAKLLDKEDDT